METALAVALHQGNDDCFDMVTVGIDEKRCIVVRPQARLPIVSAASRQGGGVKEIDVSTRRRRKGEMETWPMDDGG